jgi:hypothetical protein
MASSRTIGRLVGAGILAGVALWSAGPSTADPMRLRLENVTESDDYVGGASITGLIGGTLQGGAGSTITLQNWLNPANLVPNLGADVTIPGGLPAYTISAGSRPLFAPAVFGPGAFSDSEIEPFTAAGQYSRFAEGAITFAGSGVFTATFSDTQAAVTPQPGTMVLLGVGLIALALLPMLRRAARRQDGA